MRNRAKCKLCGDILESFHRHDYVTCKCGEISIDGGNDYYKASAKNFENFLRVDDEGNEIIVTLKEENKDSTLELENESLPRPTKKEIYELLKGLKEDYEKLPEQAMSLPISHYDMYSLLLILTELLKDEVADKE